MSFSQVRRSLGLVGLSVVGLFSTAAFAAEWVGGNANWGNVTPTVPGWSTAVAPNGIGEVAEKVDAASGTATIDAGFGPVTLGRITMGGANAFSFGVTPTAGLTLDQDGAGVGVATISNVNTSGGSTAVIVNAGPVTLADDLLISNTSNSIRTDGAVRILSTIDGIVPSVTIENVTNTFPVSTTSYAGAIRFQTGVNTFQAPVTITKGLVTFNNNNSFGDASNALTIGQAGAGLGATVVSTAAVLVPQNITIAAGTGGTTILGSVSTSNTTTALGYSGNITLNGDLTTTGASLVGTGPLFSGNITGVGALTHFGNAAGGLLGNATLSGTNDYTGVTTINSGSLQFAKKASLYNGVMGSWTDTNLVVNATGVASFYVGGFDDFTAADIQHLSGLGNGVGGFKAGSGLGLNTSNGNFTYSNNITNTNAGADALGLVKYGANTLTVSGTNTYTGITVVAQGTLQFANRASFYNGNTADWTATNLTVNAGTTAAFNVGGTGEFDASDIDIIKSLGTATGGFLGTNVAAATASNLGFDTTNAAGGEFTYNSNIANPNGGVNPMGITKIGTGTLVLSGANTYSGSTIVDGGTLRMTGSHVVDPSVTVTNTIGNYNIGSVVGADGHLIVEGNITSDNGIMVGQNGVGKMTLESGTVTLKADNAGGEQFLGIGRFAGSDGTYIQNGGSLLVGATGNSDWFVVGVDGTGTATLNAGDIKSSTFALAQGGTANGTFNINGGTVTTSANMFVVSGIGTINQTGGDLKIGTWFTLGEALTAVATYNISGGTMSTGNVASENFVLGFQGQATVNQTGGDITVANDLNMGWANVAAKGVYNLSNGTVVADQVFSGIDGVGELNQSGGTITVANFSGFGRGALGTGTYNMSGGTSNWGTDLNIGDFGIGILNHTGGTINAATPIFGWRDVSTGTGVIDGATAVLNATGGTGVVVGNFSLTGGSMLELKQGEINATNASGDFRIANQTGSIGTFKQTGGAVVISDQSYVGVNGTATFEFSNGTFEAGDNLWIGLNVTANGTMTQTGGTMTVIGNDPSYTGNVVVGEEGVGVLNMQGGLIDMIVSGYPTLNSLSYSIANSAGPNIYDLAQDGNLIVGEETGIATVNQSAGTINVAANVLVGSTNVANSSFDGSASGTLNISGGTMTVGVTSSTGGDLVLGGSGASMLANGTVVLSGGTLDVSNGSGKIGSAGGTTSFTFSGGTLKVKVFNAGDFGGNLGALVQNGAGSLLDVTGNSTAIQNNYDLGEGTATVGGNRTLSAFNVLNSAGAGVINVGDGTAALEGDYNLDGVVNAIDYVVWRDNLNSVGGGNPAGYNTWKANFGATGGGSPALLTVGAGTVAVDTLNLNNGTVTAGGGVTIDTELTGNGTINGNTVMAAAGDVAPGVGGIGELDVVGDMTLGASGTLDIEVDTNGGMFDVLDITGMLNAAGTLNVSVLNILPTVGTKLKVLDYASFAGSFAVTSSSGTWSFLSGTGEIELTAAGAGSATGVPEPTTWALLAIGLAGLLGIRSVRRK